MLYRKYVDAIETSTQLWTFQVNSVSTLVDAIESLLNHTIDSYSTSFFHIKQMKINTTKELSLWWFGEQISANKFRKIYTDFHSKCN